MQSRLSSTYSQSVMIQKHNLNMSRKMDANTLGNYYGQDYFMLDLHHLLDIMVKDLKITPFLYHTEITEDIMNYEKMDASLSSFTRAG